MQFRLRSLPLALLAIGTLSLASCATVAPTAAPTSATAAATAVATAASDAAAKVTDPNAAVGAQAVAAAAKASVGPAAAAAGTPPPPKPFAEIIKDAKEEPGFFTTWRKDDKV